MTWIRINVGFRSHWKVKRLAKMLCIPVIQVRGHLVTLWTATLEIAPDGNLKSLDDEAIEDTAEWDGEAGKFVAAMLAPEIRLLDRNEKGETSIHDWMHYAGAFLAAKKKAEQRERAKKKAEKKAEKATKKPSKTVSRDIEGTVPCLSPMTGRTDETDIKEKTDPPRAQAGGSVRPHAGDPRAAARGSTILAEVGKEAMRDVADARDKVVACPKHLSDLVPDVIGGVKRLRAEPAAYRLHAQSRRAHRAQLFFRFRQWAKRSPQLALRLS